MSKYTIPQVNLNGTSKDDLIAQWEKVASISRSLAYALIQARPHGRDYVFRPHELQAAEDEHADDYRALDGINERAEAILRALHHPDYLP
jgi:hypothetical protein